jgi:excinuclease ABC subunit C
MIDIIRHHFEKDEIDEDTMIASFSSEFWTFHLEEGFYSTVRFPWNKEERQRILKLFDDFFESYLLVNTIQWSWIMNDLLQELQNRYNLKQFPYQVECLDISHLWWDRTSWWLSAIAGWLPDKNHYRKYKITSAKNDDYLSLKEVLIRRFKLDKKIDIEEWEILHLPNVFILDWWKWQLWIIDELINEYPNLKSITKDVQFCALWKGEARRKSSIWIKSKKNKEDTVWEKLYVWKNWIIEENDFIYDDADKILIKLRDEAHRFANSYRKKQEELAFSEAKKRIKKNKD